MSLMMNPEPPRPVPDWDDLLVRLDSAAEKIDRGWRKIASALTRSS